MDTITIVDTSICTDNLGDEIIMDAVNDTVSALFPKAYVFRVPSHEQLSDRTRQFISQSNFCIVGGTNLLSSNIKPYGLWRLSPRDGEIFGGTATVCLGTGWNDYMPSATAETRKLLRAALSNDLVHSVRDSYTLNHLAAIGLNALNTSCPTTWSLTPNHCAQIPAARASAVVFTLSAWRRDIEADKAFVGTLRRLYKKIYFFPQMHSDYEYFRSFGWDDRIPATTIGAYSRFLENEDVDFVGTRLHGGIRALQKRRRALVLAIDNRAAEIGKDTGLAVLPRGDVRGIESWIEEGARTMMRLPQEAIDRWKQQFSTAARKMIPTERTRTRRFNGQMESVKKIVRTGRRWLSR